MKTLLKFAVALCAVIALAGCVNNKWRAEEAAEYYKAQKELVSTRKPLFELRAQPGQTITLAGVESLTVNDPREAEVKAMPTVFHPMWGTMGKMVDSMMQIGTMKVVADGVTDLVSLVSSNAGDHSTTTTTTTTSDSNNTRGDVLTGSIGGNASGAGAGVGTRYISRDTNVTGDRNATATRAGRDVNLGDDSASPPTRTDNSVRGDQCEGERCQSREPPPDDDGTP